MSQLGGAPTGNQNAKKGKAWADSIRKALLQYEDGDVKRGQALYRIAVTLVEQALAGDKDAMQEIGNRLDGKPAQSVDLGSDPDRPLVARIVREIVAAAQPDDQDR